MKMGTVGVARVANGTDRLAASYFLPDPHEDVGHMTVVRGHAAAVVDRHHVAAVSGPLRDDDAAGRGRADRRALVGGDIDAGVQAEAAERGVVAHPER